MSFPNSSQAKSPNRPPIVLSTAAASASTSNARNNNNSNSTGRGATNMPLAPYPPVPQHSRYSNAPTRSSLKSIPQYHTSSSMGTSASEDSNTRTSKRSNLRGAGASEGNHAPFLPLVAKVQFCHFDLVASINVNSNTSDTTDARNNQEPPRLLQVQRLRCTLPGHEETSVETTTKQPLFCLDTVAKSQDASLLNPSANSVVSSTCLDVAPWKNDQGSLPSAIATGLSTGTLCIHTPTTTSVNNDSHDPDEFGFARHYVKAPRTNYLRAATAVAWKPQPESSLVAVSWGNRDALNAAGVASAGAAPASASSVASGSERGTASSVMTGSSMPTTKLRQPSPSSSSALLNSSSSSSSDREYGCFIWDVEHSSSSGASPNAHRSPVAKLAHQTGVSSLGWILNGSTLVVGGQLRNAYLYDLRSPTDGGGATNAAATIYAHNFCVSGIEADPHRPHQFATYCSIANEPVKLWDARRTDTYVCEIKVSTATTTGGFGSESAAAWAVQWSTQQPNILSVAIGDRIYDYDTSSSRPANVGSVVTGEFQISDFCLYPYTSEQASGETWLSTLYARRAVVVDKNRNIQDVAKHRHAPLAVSRRDGRLVHGLGRTMWIGSTREGPLAMESLKIRPDEDISSTMLRRARCLHAGKYSMDAASNSKMLAEDGIIAKQADSVSPTRDSLLWLWVWIERIESFCSDSDDLYGSFFWPVKGLMDAGTLRLLTIQGPDRFDGDDEAYCAPLACSVYESPGRSCALAACGWAGRFDLVNVLSECEELEEFERSAALAVWHGDIGAAVQALQRGASAIRAKASSTREATTNTSSHSRYADFMDLVSLSVAGYRGGNDESAQSQVWRQACERMMERKEFSDSSRPPSRLSYMTALLRFLMSPDPESGHDQVLSDKNLSISDRVGFACRFLPREKLIPFLKQCVTDCEQDGNLEGLIVTGLEKEGVKILQSFVDLYADVQTATLVTSRVVFPAMWIHERRICAEWLDSYRSLLNRWQMWQSRAMFDCDRATLLRKFKAKQQSADGSVKLKKTKPPGKALFDPDVQAPIPVMLDARCNYCSSPLFSRQQDGASIEKLSKMKPVLSCCPNCRKPLPRCAICMLSLGTINPYLELIRRMSSATGAEDMSSTTNLPFAEWFCWCMNCKHGGHSHHMIGWFANHEECPVSGCNCRCQFDGIQKLNRPTLSTSRESDVNGNGSIKEAEPSS